MSDDFQARYAALGGAPQLAVRAQAIAAARSAPSGVFLVVREHPPLMQAFLAYGPAQALAQAERAALVKLPVTEDYREQP